MIYFNINKMACAFEVKDYIAKIDIDTWIIYCNYPHGVYWDIIDGEFVKLVSEEDLISLEDAETRIHELQYELESSDYRATKNSEGLYTEEEYAPYKATRQALRDEINQLRDTYPELRE